jgi:hypothetical protein
MTGMVHANILFQTPSRPVRTKSHKQHYLQRKLSHLIVLKLECSEFLTHAIQRINASIRASVLDVLRADRVTRRVIHGLRFGVTGK